MSPEKLAALEAEHAEHCQYKCCGNGAFSHHPEEGETLCPAVEMFAALRAQNEALSFAKSVIENYQMDIRNSEWVGIDLVAKGFCQGEIYLGAIDQINRMRSRQ